MPKYRKKPVVIEAEVYKPGMEDGFSPFLGHILPENVVRDSKFNLDVAYIDTLEGKHMICHGDYIITGIKGERYPCKPDIFEATYDPVE